MSKSLSKLVACRQHRAAWYERALDKLISGQAKPGDVTLRWNKYKEVKR